MFKDVHHVQYSHLNIFFLQGNPYAMKDGTAGAAGADMSAAAAWSSAAALQPTAGYYGYDHPTLAAYG